MNEKIKYLLGFLLLVVLLVVFFVFQNENQRDEQDTQRAVATGFSGNFVRGEDNAIFVQGFYTANGDVVGPTEVREEPIEVRVIITDSTIINREAFEVPDTIGEVFYPDELPKQESQVDLETLKNDASTSTIGLFVTASLEDVFNLTEFEAQEITYRSPIFSTQRE